MTNNDILRRLRYTFNFNDKKMVALFQSAGLEVTTDMVVNWLKKDDDADFVECNDTQLAYFLNGLIIDRRGANDERKQTVEKRLNNNIILVKLKIALALKSEDIVELMKDTHLKITKSELGSFLRKPDHRNYKKCNDQFLRNFLLGIDQKFNVKRPAKYVVDKEAAAINSGIYKKSAVKFSQSKAESKSESKSESKGASKAPGVTHSQAPKKPSADKPHREAKPYAKSRPKSKPGSTSDSVQKSGPTKSEPKKIYVNPQATSHAERSDKKDSKSTLSRKPKKSE